MTSAHAGRECRRCGGNVLLKEDTMSCLQCGAIQEYLDRPAPDRGLQYAEPGGKKVKKRAPRREGKTAIPEDSGAPEQAAACAQPVNAEDAGARLMDAYGPIRQEGRTPDAAAPERGTSIPENCAPRLPEETEREGREGKEVSETSPAGTAPETREEPSKEHPEEQEAAPQQDIGGKAIENRPITPEESREQDAKPPAAAWELAECRADLESRRNRLAERASQIRQELEETERKIATIEEAERLLSEWKTSRA